ncbi:hypothetical protein [Rhodobacter maris]|uniref:Uncharacterized protein n=1 Tax=Rhodobacter maris TaxID=446682 RepID=A0A285RM50_9RHOB|nr:hypothetical protein [Rhodobacter maris]SOB95193.1 hypothetical protein SAMN05877831_101838 [Rhodobacter maris]
MTAFTFPRLTAAVTALALGLTTITATPAAAMSESDRNALALLLGIGAIAAIVDQNDKPRATPHRPPPPAWGYYDRGRDHGHDRWRDDPRRADACVVRIERDRHGRRIEVQSPGCHDQGRRDWSQRR